MNTLRRTWRVDVVVPVAWALAVVAALLATLESLRHHDFDGLNNMYQLPLAMPWALVPTAIVTTHWQDAWVLAGEGLLNAALLRLWLRRRPGSSLDTFRWEQQCESEVTGQECRRAWRARSRACFSSAAAQMENAKRDAERDGAQVDDGADSDRVVMSGDLGASRYSVTRTDRVDMVCGRLRVVPGNDEDGAPAGDSGPFCYSHADLANLRLELPWYRYFEDAGQVYLGISDREIDRVEARLASGRKISIDVHDQLFALVVDSSDELADLEGRRGDLRVATCHCEDGSCVCG